MALKSFHIILILAAISFGIGLGFWGINRYETTQNQTDLYTGIVSFVLGIGLMGYLVWFLQKMKKKGW